MIKKQILLVAIFAITNALFVNAEAKDGAINGCGEKEKGTVIVGAWSGKTQAFLASYKSARVDYQYDVVEKMIQQKRVKQLEADSSVCVLGRGGSTNSVHVKGLNETKGYWVDQADFESKQ